MSVTIDVVAQGLADALGAVRDFSSDQLPFALSLGMNRAAKDAIFEARSSLTGVFDLHSRSLARTFGPFGKLGDVSRGWSSKSQWPNLRVTLHSKAHAMALQEVGGEKPYKASEVWIPSDHVPRSPTTGKKPAKYQPARLKKRLAQTKQRGATRIFQTGSTVFERTRSTGDTVPLYLRRRRAQVSPALGFEATVSRVFDRQLPSRLGAAMAKAMRTRRP